MGVEIHLLTLYRRRHYSKTYNSFLIQYIEKNIKESGIYAEILNVNANLGYLYVYAGINSTHITMVKLFV